MCATMLSSLAKIFVILCLCGFFAGTRAIGSSSFGGYTLVERPVRNVAEAKHLCANKGMTLVNIETQEKFENITYALEHLDPPMTYVQHDFWTGGYAVPETGKYFWSNGIEISILAKYWGPGRPVPSKTELCITNAFFNATQTWGLNTWDCNDRQNFMCEGIQNNQGKKYNRYNDDDDDDIPFAEKYTTVKYNWYTKDQAKSQCDGIGQDLVSVQSAKKWEKIKQGMIAMGLTNDGHAENLFWTNGIWKRGEGKFMWPGHVELPINASYWGPNQPSHYGSQYSTQNCISIEVFPGNVFGVNDMECEAKMGYMCERRKPRFHPKSSEKSSEKMEWLDIEGEIMARLNEKFHYNKNNY